MENRGLRIASDILLNTFWIGYAFIIISWLIFVLGHDTWMTLMAEKWRLDDPAIIKMVTLGFFAMAKFTLIFYALIPALAIRWTLYKLKKQSN